MGIETYTPSPFLPRTKTFVGKITTALDVEKPITGYSVEYTSTAADGDKHIFYASCDGTETTLNIVTQKNTGMAIYDLYINGVLDSSTYDEYAGSSTTGYRTITLTQPTVSGINIIELRVNGKNASSSGYLIYSYWMRLS